MNNEAALPDCSPVGQHATRAATLTWKEWCPLLLSVVCNGARFHLDAFALKAASPLAVVIVGSLCAALGFLLAGVVWRWLGWTTASLDKVNAASLKLAWSSTGWILPSTAAAGAGGAWFITVSNQQYGPAVTAFLANLTLIFLVLAGLIGGEKFRFREFTAMGVIAVGAFLFSYRGGTFQWGALGIMGAGCLLNSGKQLLTKKATGLVHLPTAMALSQFFIGMWAVGLSLVTGGFYLGSLSAFLLLVASGVLGSMMGMSLLYVGYHRVGVARGSALDAMRPLPVLLIGLLLGAPLPSSLQLLGAFLVLTGSAVLPLLGRRKTEAPVGDAGHDGSA